MKRSVFLGLALTTFISFAGFSLSKTSVTAQGHPQCPPPQDEPQGRRGGPGGGEGMMFRNLDLTNEQNDQIKKLHEAEKAASETIREQLKTIHEQLRTATKDGAFNESAVRTLLAQTQQPELELEVLHLKTRTAIYNLLTPAQKAKLTESQPARERNHDGPPPPRD
jgi:Spy/CpxP family protein refolding chaperone